MESTHCNFHFFKKIIYFIIFLLIANCNVKTASNIHGISSLKSKSKNITISKSNKNLTTEIIIINNLRIQYTTIRIQKIKEPKENITKQYAVSKILHIN